MDAGARGRRLLQRREYRAKVSEFIPKELEDQFSYNKNGELVFELDLKKIGQKLKTGLKNFISKPIMKDYPSKKEYQDSIQNKTSNQYQSYEPEGEMIEANSAQMKAMHDAKMKKMEDDKVASKKKNVKEESELERIQNAIKTKTMNGKPLTDKQIEGLKAGLTQGGNKVQEACWKGYEKKGMKTMFGKRYPNCVKKTKKEEVELEAKKSCGEGEYYCHDEQKCKPIPDGMKVGKDGMLVKEDMKGMSQKSGDKRSTESGAGMTAKGVAKYNRRTGGNLKTAVTTPPSKLKPGSKAAKRRKSFCARSRSWTGPRGKAARRRWNCSYEPELPMIIDEKKKLFNTAPLSDRVSNWSKKISEALTPDRNAVGLPKDLKSVEKKIKNSKTGRMNTGGDGTASRFDSYEPQGEMIEMAYKGKINSDVLKDNPNLDPNKPGDYIKLKRLSAKVKKINERKKLNPNAIFPTVSNVKIKNEIISDSGISNKNSVKKKFPTEAKMTSSEKDKKEKYVKGMKKDKKGFTKRYGKDGESVMYATATKMAMKEGDVISELDFKNINLKNIKKNVKTTIDDFGAGLKVIGDAIRNPGTGLNPNTREALKLNKKLNQSYEPQGEMTEAKTDRGKSESDKRNNRNQRAFGNRRNANPMRSIEDTERRRYNTEKGRGVKTKGQKDKRPMDYYTRDKDARLSALFKSKGIKYPKMPSSKDDKYRTEDFYKKKYDVRKGGYQKTDKMTKSNKRSGDSKAQHRELHKDLAKYKIKKLKTEGSLHSWFKGSKSKDGKPGWVNVVTGGTCASDKPGEGTPKCVSSSKRASMTKAERLSASRRKKKADPGQQSKSGAAKPTYVATDKKKK
tara:strand:+ start:179 stop:2722 length:2544 start_codon:yes stop_codon:yes gene_type:complete